MANLVLRTNIANKTFNIQHKVLQTPVQAGIVELIITPISTHTIDAKDFSFGFLPKQISSIVYENLGEKVIAKVNIPFIIDSTKTLNIYAPIFGKSFIKKDSFNLIDITNVNENVLVFNKSTQSKSTNGNKITYKINNDLNKKSLLFTKKFTVVDDNYFSPEPTYDIKNDSTRYTVISKIERNGSNKIVSKSFDFFYNSPKVISESIDTEIHFEAKTKTKTVNTNSKTTNYWPVATKKEEEKIYSIDRGMAIGKGGGTKRIVVKGIPGSRFKIMISNSDNNTYDIKTGVFHAGGGIIEGIVPSPRNGRSFGESIIRVKIPRTTASETITTKFITDTIDHKSIISPTTAERAGGGLADSADVTSSKTTLSVTVDATGSFIGEKVILEGGGDPVTTILLGKGNAETLTFIESGNYSFEFVVRSSAGATPFIAIERQPLFVAPTGDTDNFVAWDSGSDKDEALTEDGVTIPSDWDFEDTALASGLSVKIEAKVKGIGTINTATSSYESILVKGYISVNNVGTTSSELKFKLLNFLTLKTPS